MSRIKLGLKPKNSKSGLYLGIKKADEHIFGDNYFKAIFIYLLFFYIQIELD